MRFEVCKRRKYREMPTTLSRINFIGSKDVLMKMPGYIKSISILDFFISNQSSSTFFQKILEILFFFINSNSVSS